MDRKLVIIIILYYYEKTKLVFAWFSTTML